MPSRYKRVLDKATGKHYYYDKETKETVSELYVLRCKSRRTLEEDCRILWHVSS